MAPAEPSFGVRLKTLRESSGFTQEELATIAGLSVHAVSALERGQRRRPQLETVRALSAALDLTPTVRDELLASARPRVVAPAPEELGGLRIPLTGLVGRDSEFHLLQRLLADPGIRLITLVGPGGVGKTRLVMELARTLAITRATRVAFASLAEIRDPALVGSTIAEAFGCGELTGRDLPGRARAVCDGNPTLLVLDNFEHVMDAAPLVADLVAAVPPLKIVVTSRAPLHLRGEREFALSPLTLGHGAESMPLSDLAEVAAVRLFLERARDIRPGFCLTTENAGTVVAICRRLDALPLALELAAPWLKVLTLENLYRRLEKGVALPSDGPRDLPERQQTMNATVAWSYELLDPHEQRAFRRLGALPGQFPIDAAGAVLCGRDHCDEAQDEALRAAANLIDKSLLVRTGPSVVPTCTLFQMFETVRAFAAAKLDAAGEREDAMEGLTRYCLSEAALAQEGLFGSAQIQWLDRTREDLRSHRAALAWLLERGRAEEAALIAFPFRFFWIIRGHAAEGLRWYERILNVPSLPRRVEVKALIGAAMMRYAQGDLLLARVFANRVLASADVADDRAVALEANMFSGHVEHALGNGRLAAERFTESLAGFRELGLTWAIGHALSGLAWVVVTEGDFDRAESLLDEASVVLASSGPWFMTLGLYLRTVLAVRRGDPDRALAVGRELLERIRQYQDTFAYTYALLPLAAAAAQKGDDVWVARLIGARDAVRDRTGATVVDPMIQEFLQQPERRARERLGPKRWARSHAAGRRISVESLLADIDTALARPSGAYSLVR
jgi:predicted ATPase/DNA-binding XRE family transcriptional regulator